jgi:hypothetical protein
VILRATQFHSFVAELIQRLGPDTKKEILVPAGVRLQPIETEEVADRLLELTKTEITGLAEDIGGPEVLSPGGHGERLPGGSQTASNPTFGRGKDFYRPALGCLDG